MRSFAKLACNPCLQHDDEVLELIKLVELALFVLSEKPGFVQGQQSPGAPPSARAASRSPASPTCLSPNATWFWR